MNVHCKVQIARNFNEAGIPIERAKAAIMLVSGEKDRMWPAAEMGEQIIARLENKGYPYPYLHQRFNSGHNGLIINREMWREIFLFLGENFQQSKRDHD